MYQNIQTDKPFIKNDNNNQIIIEKYHYIENPGNSNDMVIVNGSNNDFDTVNNNINTKSNDKDMFIIDKCITLVISPLLI